MLTVRAITVSFSEITIHITETSPQYCKQWRQLTKFLAIVMSQDSSVRLKYHAYPCDTCIIVQANELFLLNKQTCLTIMFYSEPDPLFCLMITNRKKNNMYLYIT